jgi:hypothetical protein
MDPIKELERLRHEMLRLRERLVTAFSALLSDPANINLDQIIMDFTSLDAAIGEINVLTASLQSTISGDVSTAVAAQAAADAATQASAVAAAVAAQKTTDQTDLEAQVVNLNDAIAALKAQATPASDTQPAAFTVSPSPVVIPLASTAPVALSFSGGTGAITATGLPAGVTFDGANLVPDGTQTAGDTSVTFSDSSTPTPLQVTETVTVQ